MGEFEFDQIKLRTAELADLERLKKSPTYLRWETCCNHSSTFMFLLIFFILACNKDYHEISHAIEFRPRPITDYSVKPHSHCAGVATVHPDAGQPVYRDAPGHIS